jgi:hypothetical protein
MVFGGEDEKRTRWRRGRFYIYIYIKKLEVKITIEWRQGLFIFGI